MSSRGQAIGGEHGLSSGDLVAALDRFLGSTAGVSGPVITKQTETWKAEQRTFATHDLTGVDYVYMWPTASTSTSDRPSTSPA